MRYAALVMTLAAPIVLGLALPSTNDGKVVIAMSLWLLVDTDKQKFTVAALKRVAETEEKRAPAVETAGNWDKDDDDAVAYAWYEEEPNTK